jgi:hypothetical protein
MSGSECTEPVNPRGDFVALDLNGVTASTLEALCHEGYRSSWSDNTGDLFRKGAIWEEEKTCPFEHTTADGSPITSFDPPWVHGPWVVTWQLISPTGSVVVTAQYTTTIDY